VKRQSEIQLEEFLGEKGKGLEVMKWIEKVKKEAKKRDRIEGEE